MNEDFLVETASWANDSQTPSHPKAKLLNNIKRLNLIHRIKIFACKLIRQKLSTKFEINTNGYQS